MGDKLARGMVGAVLLIVMTTVASAAEKADRLSDPVRAELTAAVKAAYDAATGGDCKSTLATLAPVLGRRDFAGLPEQVRAAAYELNAACAMGGRDSATAYRSAMTGTALPSASAQLWRIRLGIEVQEKRNAAAVDTLEAMAAHKPEALNAVPIRWIYNLTNDLRRASPDKAPANGALRRRALAVLAGPAYEPDEIGAAADPFIKDYAGLLADSDKAAAAALVGRIREPGTLIIVSLDPRLRAFIPADFDARAASEQALARAREVAASHARSLRALIEVSDYLQLLGRPAEALATLDAARPGRPQAAAFDDEAEQRNWWWNDLAGTYAMLGRYDDMLAAYRHGIDAKEDGGLNVSQTINLAGTQNEFGRSIDALATLKPFDGGNYPASPFGLMQMRHVRGCARFALKQDAAAREDLAYVTAHERDDPKALTTLRLCAGDMDGAAQSMIRRLDDPEERAGALRILSDFDPVLPGAARRVNDDRYTELKARADVQAAIARAGGTRRFRVQR